MKTLRLAPFIEEATAMMREVRQTIICKETFQTVVLVFMRDSGMSVREVAMGVKARFKACNISESLLEDWLSMSVATNVPSKLTVVMILEWMNYVSSFSQESRGAEKKLTWRACPVPVVESYVADYHNFRLWIYQLTEPGDKNKLTGGWAFEATFPNGKTIVRHEVSAFHEGVALAEKWIEGDLPAIKPEP